MPSILEIAGSGSPASESAGLMTLTDETLDDLMAAPLAVVIVTDAGSANAARYLADVGAAVRRGELAGVTVAVLDREAAAGSRFAEAQPWLTGFRLVPYTLVFVQGQRVDAFAAVQAAVLLARLARPNPVAPVANGAGRVGCGPGGDWWSVPLVRHRPAA